MFSDKDAEMLVLDFISQLDYCNALFAGLLDSKLRWLQLVQNAAASADSHSPFTTHYPSSKITTSTPCRIDFKILLTTYQALHGLGPL